MAFPISSATKVNLDSATDDPSLARAELVTLIDKFNELNALLSQTVGASLVVVRDVNGKVAGDVTGNSATVGGYTPSKTPGANAVPVLSTLGDLSLGANAVMRSRTGYVTAINVGMTAQAVLCGSGSAGATALAVNFYHDGERFRYSASGTAKGVLADNSGNLTYNTAASGVTDGIITWATTNNIHHSGNYPAAPVLVASGVSTGSSASIPLLSAQAHHFYTVSVYSPNGSLNNANAEIKRQTSGNDTLEIAGTSVSYKVYALNVT